MPEPQMWPSQQARSGPAEEGQCHDSSGLGGGGAQAGGHLTMRFCLFGGRSRSCCS